MMESASSSSSVRPKKKIKSCYISETQIIQITFEKKGSWVTIAYMWCMISNNVFLNSITLFLK